MIDICSVQPNPIDKFTSSTLRDFSRSVILIYILSLTGFPSLALPSINFSLFCQIKEGEIGEECSTHGRDEKRIQYFRWKTWRVQTTRKI
jgi:hypothetical protein